ncbi:hypothetical protein Efla_006263 [Eimeria flavescens]
MTNCRENARPCAPPDLDGLLPSPASGLLNALYKKRSFLPHVENHHRGVSSSRSLSGLARLCRFVLCAVAVRGPLLIECLSGAPTAGRADLTAAHQSVGASLPNRAPHAITSFVEVGLDSEPVVEIEGVEAAANEEKPPDSQAAEHLPAAPEMLQAEPSDFALEAPPLAFKALDEEVPFLLPLRPVAPRPSEFNGDGIASPGLDFGDLQPSLEFAGPQPAGFYGPQSDELQVDDCQHFDAFLVSPLPSSVASRFANFVQKEAAQEDGMPYLHHIHRLPSADAADGEANPRLVIEGGKVTPLWSEDTDDTPIFSMEEGNITLLRLVAPVRDAYDAVASMMLMPIISVNLAYGDGLLLSYRVSGDEGRQVNHQHVDGMHRPVAELDVVYKSCFAAGGSASEPIPVRAELRFGGCEPVILMWRVVYLASGFHVSVGPATPTPTAEGFNSARSSAASLLDPSKAPFPSVADLRELIAKQGDLVVDGLPSQQVAAMQAASLVFSPVQNFVEMYLWCSGCESGKLDLRVPTVGMSLCLPVRGPRMMCIYIQSEELVITGVSYSCVQFTKTHIMIESAAELSGNNFELRASLALNNPNRPCVGSAAVDLEVMYPLLYSFAGKRQEPTKANGRMPSLVASRPSSHITLREVSPGAEENVHRLILEFQCKTEGEFASRLGTSKALLPPDVQIFFKKQCVAPVLSSVRDPSCSSGILSEDGTGCCLASCGTCGGDGCEDREGGLMGCCLTHIHSSAPLCDASTAPCVMKAVKSAAAQEIGTSLALLDEERPSRFRLLLGAIWLILFAASLVKLFCWCLAVACLVVYLFSICYGVHVLKEPLTVAATPSVSQLLNASFILTGHLRHLYRTHWGSTFGNTGFHCYAPFEEHVQSKSSMQAHKENPFFQNARWRAETPGTSFIRLTSFKDKSAQKKQRSPQQVPRPMEFCDVEAQGSASGTRHRDTEDIQWGEPQEEFTTDAWDDDTSGLMGAGSQDVRVVEGNSDGQYVDGLSDNQNQPFPY